VSLTGFNGKVFGEEAYGKFATQCKVGSNVFVGKKTVFFPASSVWQCVSTKVQYINEEAFKVGVADVVKYCSDTALQ
jgi:hypothetical protein